MEARQIAFSVLGDISKAHRRFKHCEEEHGYLWAARVTLSPRLSMSTRLVPLGSPVLATGGPGFRRLEYGLRIIC